jgi:hypothetical protein
MNLKKGKFHCEFSHFNVITRFVDILNISVAEFKMNIPAKENCCHVLCTHPTHLTKREKAKDSPKMSPKLSLSDTVCVFSADGNGRVGIEMR